MVLQRSMLDCGGQSAIGICTLFYIYIDLHEMCQVWCSGIQGIYAQLLGVNLP